MKHYFNEAFDKRYICQICNNPVKDLTLHNKNVHEGINGKNFGSIANFEEHVNSLHKGIEYKCHLCESHFLLVTLAKAKDNRNHQ